MKTRSAYWSTSPSLKTLAVAAALVCAAGASQAGNASLKITSFDVNAAAYSNLYVWSVDALQSFTMTAQNGGGLYGSASDSYSAANWSQGLNRSAATSAAAALGNQVQFTDSVTAATTGGFNLSAAATGATYPQPALADFARATGLNSGRFTLLDEAGNFAAGQITFDVYYTLSAATPGSTSALYSQTTLTATGSNGGSPAVSFSDGLLSSSLAGGTGQTSGHFTWSYALSAGQYATYALSGTAIASAVAPVPEPETYLLMAGGLAFVAAIARRRRQGMA